MNLALLDKTGLTNTELGTIIGVTRVTVYKWRNKKSSPHKIVRARLEKIVAAMSHLLTTCQLPLKTDLSKEQRAAKVEQLAELMKQVR